MGFIGYAIFHDWVIAVIFAVGGALATLAMFLPSMLLAETKTADKSNTANHLNGNGKQNTSESE